MRPLVSFVVPVRNNLLRLQRCLNSIVRNDYPRALIEIIVVDHESTDGASRAAREYGAIVIRSAGNSLAAHRNRGARAALGSIIAFADSDHEIDRNWCETAVDALSEPHVAATGNLAVKHAAFERVGGFDESLTMGENVDLCNRLTLAGFRIVAIQPDGRPRSTRASAQDHRLDGLHHDQQVAAE